MVILNNTVMETSSMDTSLDLREVISNSYSTRGSKYTIYFTIELFTDDKYFIFGVGDIYSSYSG